jgi:hypothetical protein
LTSQAGRYISVERIFEESQESYHETLERSSAGWHDGKHDQAPWMDYFWGVMLRAYREFEDRVGTIGLGKGSKTEQVRQIVNRRIGPFSISDIEADCIGVSGDMIRIVLRQLRDEGVIMLQGKGRWANWITSNVSSAFQAMAVRPAGGLERKSGCPASRCHPSAR